MNDLILNRGVKEFFVCNEGEANKNAIKILSELYEINRDIDYTVMCRVAPSKGLLLLADVNVTYLNINGDLTPLEAFVKKAEKEVISISDELFRENLNARTTIF
ncbi:MAG: hypothetical protein IJP38_08120 [Oscillospiraceae bacterium]|nr:hypothetical protein [Oscillospiraceae bacterium]